MKGSDIERWLRDMRRIQQRMEADAADRRSPQRCAEW
jgi:hypothetical protein